MGATIGLFGDLFSIGSAIVGGNSSKNASRNAQAAQISGINNATGQINSGQAAINAALAPYTQAGAGAQAGVNDLLGIYTPGSSGVVDWGAYVQGNPDALANWNAVNGTQAGTPFNGDINAFGQYHYNADGSRRDLEQFRVGATQASGGADAQAAAIANLQNSPLYQSLYRAGEEAVLQNASATGNIRGGNVQRGLANFGSDTLAQVIQQQLANLSGVANSGLDASGTQAGHQGATSTNLANLSTTAGDVNAGGILQRSAINANTLNSIAKSAGSIMDGGGAGNIISSIGKLF